MGKGAFGGEVGEEGRGEGEGVGVDGHEVGVAVGGGEGDLVEVVESEEDRRSVEGEVLVF